MYTILDVVFICMAVHESYHTLGKWFQFACALKHIFPLSFPWRFNTGSPITHVYSGEERICVSID